MKDQIIEGDIKEVCLILPEKSVNCIVTSPPYWGLRDYGTAEWVGGNDPGCDHKVRDTPNSNTSSLTGSRQTCNHEQEGYKSCCKKCGAIRQDKQIGLEETPEEYVNCMVEIFRELRRVLRDDGTLWLNLGDSYGAAGGDTYSGFNQRWSGTGGAGSKQDATLCGVTGRKPETGLRPKNLVGIPWRVAFALQADGWYLRSDIIWHKPNPMPESVTDRPTKAHEYIFLLAKEERYYYDNEVIMETAAGGRESFSGDQFGNKGLYKTRNDTGRVDKSIVYYRNKRSVWTVSTKSYKEAHFATFPPDLIRPCILAGCPPGGVVLDPFFGSGTVGQVCIETGRHYLGIELNPEYIELAKKRIAGSQPALIALGTVEKEEFEQGKLFE